MDSIKSARDTIDDIAESVDNFHVIRIPLHGWFAIFYNDFIEGFMICDCSHDM
jgi:hypothetical protein